MSVSVHTICTCNIRLLRLFHFFLCCFILPCHTASYCPGLSRGLFRLHSSLRLSLPPFTNICLVIRSICSCFSNLLTHFLCVRCGVICVCVCVWGSETVGPASLGVLLVHWGVARVVCMRYIFILNKIWTQHKTYILVGTWLGWNILLIT
jgi:hypothetical protein